MIDAVAALEPLPADVVACDGHGNSCVHIAAVAADYDMVKVRERRRQRQREPEQALDQTRWYSSVDRTKFC